MIFLAKLFILITGGMFMPMRKFCVLPSISKSVHGFNSLAELMGNMWLSTLNY